MIDCLYLLFLLLIRPQTEKGPHRKEGSERKIPSFSPPHSFSHKFSAPPPSIKKNEEEEGEKRRWRWRRRRRKRERFCRGSLARMLEEEEEEVHCGGVGFTIHGIKSKVARKKHTKTRQKIYLSFLTPLIMEKILFKPTSFAPSFSPSPLSVPGEGGGWGGEKINFIILQSGKEKGVKRGGGRSTGKCLIRRRQKTRGQ